MQAVPSLIATGTAIAAATNGWVLGESPKRNFSYSTLPDHLPSSGNADAIRPYTPRASSLPITRPFTSSAIASSTSGKSTLHDEPPQNHAVPNQLPIFRRTRPSTAQPVPPKLQFRRRSLLKQDPPSTASREASRDSVSSSGSWMRRLSFRAPSQHDSVRDSTLFDTTSLAFSHTSGAPILVPSDSAAASLPPNKLVKRKHSAQASPSRKRSRPHLLSLRRPATSHQRSATLHNLSATSEPWSRSSQLSFDRPLPLAGAAEAEEANVLETSSFGWISFFHARTSDPAEGKRPSRSNEATSQDIALPTRRLQLRRETPSPVHLVKPEMLMMPQVPATSLTGEEQVLVPGAGANNKGNQKDSSLFPEEPVLRRTRRSLSVTLSSAGDWMSRTSGSIRRPKRSFKSTSTSGRHVSDSYLTSRNVGKGVSAPMADTAATHSVEAEDKQPVRARRLAHQYTDSDSLASFSLPLRSRPSSLRQDSLGKPASEYAASAFSTRLHGLGPSTWSSTTSLNVAHSQRQREPSRGTGISSVDTNDFVSLDEDTDFKSDDPFDSLRTTTSGPTRTAETSADSMSNDSPASVLPSQKKHRLSIHEILTRPWDEDMQIPEEEEGSTGTSPGRSGHARRDGDVFEDAMISLDRRHISTSASARDFGRLSMEDDFDDEWARDEDAPLNSLSPPSKANLTGHNAINPNVRLALSSISGNLMAEPSHLNPPHNRPLSNLFDWSEPGPDKLDGDNQSARPMTAYGKSQKDPRGGRSAMRKGPMPVHVRSQSVPVVHGLDDSKSGGSKYGTWAMGTKTVSEDWDEDFEFIAGEGANGSRDLATSFAVPESIRATQPSVKAHSGQIREFSLLVNDLKRLCRHARDLDVLDGPYSGLWKEAEGIIALASPDEEELWSEDKIDEDEVNVRTDDGSSGSADRPEVEAVGLATDDFDDLILRNAVFREKHSPRRRSVFSPEDDIFGGHYLSTENNNNNNDKVQRQDASRPRTPETHPLETRDVLGAVRNMVEAKGHHPSNAEDQLGFDRVQFDTNSLKMLVKRAGDLRDSLSQLVRMADQIMSTPTRTPRYERRLDSSPAFTKVFDEPGSSPPRRAV